MRRLQAALAVVLSACVTTATLAPNKVIAGAAPGPQGLDLPSSAGLVHVTGETRLRLRVLGPPGQREPGVLFDLRLRELQAAGPAALLLPPFDGPRARIPLEQLGSAELIGPGGIGTVGVVALAVLGALVLAVGTTAAVALSQVETNSPETLTAQRSLNR